MTHQDDYNLSPKTAAELAKNGWEAIPEMIRILVNQAMQEERARYLQADEYERSDDRKGYANGYKPKRVKTRVGEITFSIPQVRESGFYPSALEKGMRSERALVMSLAEMYVHGVSTRKVKEITEQLCGVEISAAQVSRATAQLDQVLQEWRERPLGEIPISTWMPATRRCARAVRCGMRPYWWPPASMQMGIARFWEPQYR